MNFFKIELDCAKSEELCLCFFSFAAHQAVSQVCHGEYFWAPCCLALTHTLLHLTSAASED